MLNDVWWIVGGGQGNGGLLLFVFFLKKCWYWICIKKSSCACDRAHHTWLSQSTHTLARDTCTRDRVNKHTPNQGTTTTRPKETKKETTDLVYFTMPKSSGSVHSFSTSFPTKRHAEFLTDWLNFVNLLFFLALKERQTIVHLSKTSKKTKEVKAKLIAQIKEASENFQFVWLFTVDHVRTAYLQDIRSSWKPSRYVSIRGQK
jgi:hypothetical protein